MRIRGLFALLADRLNREEVYNQAEFWDNKAREFRGQAISMWPNNSLNELYHEEQVRLLEDFLPDLQGLRVIDVGCGYGRLSGLFASRGAQVVGIDFSAESIALAQRETTSSNPWFRVESVFELAEVSQYDLAVSWGTLAIACKDHYELRMVLERLRTALATGGRLLLLEPIHRGLLHRVLNMSKAEFVDVMSEVGLEPERTRHLHFWPARLLLAFIGWPRWVTRLGYAAGDLIMTRFLKGRRGGDYLAILTRPK